MSFQKKMIGIRGGIDLVAAPKVGDKRKNGPAKTSVVTTGVEGLREV